MKTLYGPGPTHSPKSLYFSHSPSTEYKNGPGPIHSQAEPNQHTMVGLSCPLTNWPFSNSNGRFRIQTNNDSAIYLTALHICGNFLDFIAINLFLQAIPSIFFLMCIKEDIVFSVFLGETGVLSSLPPT